MDPQGQLVLPELRERGAGLGRQESLGDQDPRDPLARAAHREREANVDLSELTEGWERGERQDLLVPRDSQERQDLRERGDCQERQDRGETGDRQDSLDHQAHLAQLDNLVNKEREAHLDHQVREDLLALLAQLGH